MTILTTATQEALKALEKGDTLCEINAAHILRQALAAAPPLALPESAGEVVTKLLELARIVYNAADDWGESHADGTSTIIFQKSEADALDAIFDYFDTLPENPDPLILDSGPLKAARTMLHKGGV